MSHGAGVGPGLLIDYSTFVVELKNKNIPNSLCLGWGGGCFKDDQISKCIFQGRALCGPVIYCGDCCIPGGYRLVCIVLKFTGRSLLCAKFWCRSISIMRVSLSCWTVWYRTFERSGRAMDLFHIIAPWLSFEVTRWPLSLIMASYPRPWLTSLIILCSNSFSFTFASWFKLLGRDNLLLGVLETSKRSQVRKAHPQQNIVATLRTPRPHQISPFCSHSSWQRNNPESVLEQIIFFIFFSKICEGIQACNFIMTLCKIQGEHFWSRTNGTYVFTASLWGSKFATLKSI